MINRRSLTFRLVFWYCGLLMVLGGAFSAYVYIGFGHYLRETLRITLSARAEATWDLVREAGDDRAKLALWVEQRFTPEAFERFMRISRDGQVIYVSGPLRGRLREPDAIAKPWADDLGRLREVPLSQGGSLQIYSVAHDTADGHHVVIETGRTSDALDAASDSLEATLLVALPILLLLAAGGGYVLVRRAFAPLADMITAAEALTFNSPHNRLPLAATGDQVEELGHSLNRMLERLDHAYQHARRFSADAAHELRTPLTIMRGELELIALRDDVAPDIQASVGNALDEGVRLGQIVESLLSLARLDSIAGKREHRPVDLRALTIETIEQMQLVAEAKAIALTCAEGGPLTVSGDRDRLKQVMVNLLDNAIKYTPAGGRVWVEMAAAGDKARVTVSDTGIGIAPEDQPLVFERFFRVAASRGESGAGLGLAIVKSICLAHGGAVTLESVPGQGSRFRLELPLAG